MAVPTTRQRAKELVQQIAKNHGYLGEEKLRSIEPGLRREIEEALLKKDEMIGSSVITLAKNLYTSKARFVFELLQNADDNNYTKAAAVGETPYVSFRVFPRRIIMECNEDGFTNENLEAICSVGKSSKSGSQGYIGEKGIGFKSVFMAAWKAHIQSGTFSFSFSHKNGESGMGMISPIWEDAQEERDLSLTRLTLHLHDTGDPNALANTHKIIQEQFQELQETILLFMKNLRMIRVAFYGIDGAESSSMEYSIERPKANRAVLTRTVTKDRAKTENVKHYHVTTHQATRIPRHENRTYSGEADNTSQVVLAFPLEESSVPIIEPQDIFVYLPVRPVGFKFIIQADFVTDASRQDIVKDSLRNTALLNGVADAFARAVLQFCEHDALRLRWMRYLPDKNDKNWGSLWLSLVNKISDCLSQIPVLYCHKKFDRHLIADLVRLRRDVYADGEPLFEDGDPEIIVSQQYGSTDLEILKDYGLNYAHIGHILKWLASDLAQGAQSRMRSNTTTASWHTQAAKLLHLPFAHGWIRDSAELKLMTLLPLEGGTWVSATSGPVYFAKVDGLDIPPNIGLRIIDDTITNTHRITLFKDLGVRTAPISLVRKKILALYEKPAALLPDLSVQASKQQLTFLYLTQHLEPADDDYSDISVFDEDECMRKPSKAYMYLATDKNPYSPWELLKGSGSLSGPGSNAPGFMLRKFVHEGYFQDPPQTPPGQALNWTEWFHRHLGVEDYVNLGDEKGLSYAGKYLQEHRPERFLGALRIHHHHKPRLSPQFIAWVQEIPVLCQENQQIPLKNTYFPTKRLEDLVGRFVEQDVFFPWLWIDSQIPHETLSASWDTFLNKCNGGVPLDDVEFALDMLKYSLPALKSSFSPESESKLCNLYIYIDSQYLGKRENETRDRIREMVAENNAIYVPLADSYTWASPQDCVWSAAQELHTKFVLEILYESWLSKSSENRRDLKRFFCDALGISDCTNEIYVDELKNIRDSGSEDSDIITTVYEALYSLWNSSTVKGITRNWLKEQFDNHALIYVVSNEGPSWRKASQCVWSTAARLRDMVSLNNEYEELRGFFVGVLGVRPVTLKMAIDELKQAGSRQEVVVEEVKASLLTVNSLLCSEQDQKQGEELEKSNILPVESKIFPVRYPGGEVQCVSAQTEFFIVDRESLRLKFEDRVKFLDFSLEEVSELRPFFGWAGLENRYVTRHVRESTSARGSDARPISRFGHEIRHKAHSLLRIAWHFQSPRVTTPRDSDNVYELLRNAKILATNTIFLEFSLSQDGTSHKAKGDSIKIHLDEEGPNLTVYLPCERAPQEHAFRISLPERLLRWLMTDEKTLIYKETSGEAILAVTNIMATPLSTLSEALDKAGIRTIDTPDLDANTEENSPETDSYDDDNSVVVDTPPSAPDTARRDGSSTRFGSNSSESFTPEGIENESNTPPVRLTAQSRPATSAEESVARDILYVRVLGRVIASARTSSIPDRNANQANAALRGSSSIYGSDQFERDCKVGAAGELFVFELLCHLDPALPDFSRANWQSNMRHYVTVHPDYANMSPWTGRETSDITYMDTQGLLTDLLIRNHYLDRDRWEGRTPKYFIEVKTTTSSCDAPFYMSNAQYQRMRNVTLSEENRSEIYVIFRVYQLDQGDQAPGLKLYLDPESLRLSRALDFTATTWSVTPGENAL